MKKVFLAGATGAIGKRLVPLLLDAGYEVFGTTRSHKKGSELQAAGVRPIVVNALDAPALSEAMAAIRPEIVIHQLTDLPAGLEPSGMAEGIARTTRIRIEGTRLVAAAFEAGAAVWSRKAWLVGFMRMDRNPILKMLLWISARTPPMPSSKALRRWSG